MPKLRKSRSVLQALKRSAAWVIAFLMIIPMSLNLQAAPDREGWGDLVAAFAELSSFSTDVPHWTAQDQVVPVGQEYVDLTIMLDWGNVTPAHIGIALITLSFEPIAFTHESSSIILPEGVAGSLQRTPPSVLPVEPPLAVQAFQLVGLGGIVGPGHLGYVGLNVRLNIEDGFLANPGDSIEIGMLLAAMQGFPANQTHVTITRGALPTFDILYQGNPQEGGTVANLPANQMDLIAGSHPLTPGAAPTHSSVVRDGVLTSVVFEGWTSAPTNQIFTQENLPSRITTVTIEDGNVNVYAVWSWGVPLEHLLTVENLGMARPANQRPIGGLIEAGADLRPWTPGTPAAGSGLEFRGWVEPGHGLQIGQQAPPLTDEVWITPPTHMPAADLTVIAVWVCEEGYIGGRLDPNEYRLTVENLGMARPANQRPIGGMVAAGADLRPWTPGTPAAGSGLQFHGWVEPGHGLQIGQQAPPLTDEVWITPPTHMPAADLTVIAVWVCEEGYIGGRPDPNEYRLTIENLGMARPANQRPIGGMVAAGADLRPWTPGTPAAGSGLQFHGWAEPGHGLQIGQQAPPLTDEVWITPPTHMPAADLTVIAVWVCEDGYIGGRPDPNEYRLTVENLGMARPANQRPIGGMVAVGADLRPWTPGTPAAGSGLQFRGWVEPDHGLQIGQQAPPLTDEVWITPPTHMPANNLTVIAVWVCEDGYIGGRPDPNEYRLTVENLGMARPANQRPIGGMVAVGADLRPWTPGTPAAGSGLQFRGWVEPGHGLQIGQQAPPLTDEVWITPPTHMPATDLTVIAVWVCGDGYIGGRPDDNDVAVDVDDEGNVTITPPVDGSDSDLDDDGNITITLPDTDEGDVSVNVPDDWTYDKQQDGDDVIIVVTPANRPLVVNNFVMPRPTNQTPVSNETVRALSVIGPWAEGTPEPGWHFLGWARTNANLNVGQPFPEGDRVPVAQLPHRMPNAGYTVWAVWGDRDGNVGQPDRMDLTVSNVGMARPTDQRPISTPYVTVGTAIGPWVEGTPQLGFVFLGWAGTDERLIIGQRFPEADRIPANQLPNYMPTEDVRVWAVWGNDEGYIGLRNTRPLTVRNAPVAVTTTGQTPVTNLTQEVTSILTWNPGTAAPPEPEASWTFLGWTDTAGRGQLVVGQRPPAGLLMSTQAIQVALPSMPNIAVTRYAVWGDDEGRFGIPNPPPVGGGPDIDINVDDDGNVTTNPPNLPYDRDNDGIITIPLPPGTDPGDVNVNVPGDDWDYDIVEDEDGNWKVVITPPFRNLVVTNLPSQITRPTNQRPVSGQFRVGARIVENVAGWIPGTPPTGWHFLGWASTNQGLVVGEPVPDGIRIPAAQLPTRMLGDGVRVYALWGDGEGRFGQPDPPPVGDPTFTLTYVANAQQNGTVTNMPANRDGLAPGAHGLGNVVPRHTPVNRNGVSTHVVFRGWSAAPANQIFAHGATLPTLLTEVTITDANVRVYAVWGWGEPVAPGDDKRQVPKTGDQSNMLLWMMLFGLGLLGFAATSTKLVIGRTNKEKPRVIIIEDAYNKEHHIIK